jgi:hypothetical protein
VIDEKELLFFSKIFLFYDPGIHLNALSSYQYDAAAREGKYCSRDISWD